MGRQCNLTDDDREVFTQLYEVEHMSMEDLATTYECSRNSVRDRVEKWGLERKLPSELKELLSVTLDNIRAAINVNAPMLIKRKNMKHKVLLPYREYVELIRNQK